MKTRWISYVFMSYSIWERRKHTHTFILHFTSQACAAWDVQGSLVWITGRKLVQSYQRNASTTCHFSSHSSFCLGCIYQLNTDVCFWFKSKSHIWEGRGIVQPAVRCCRYKIMKYHMWWLQDCDTGKHGLHSIEEYHSHLLELLFKPNISDPHVCATVH